MIEQSPAQRAQEEIDRIEKRYKKPSNRLEAVYHEAIFWSDIWASMGLHTDPAYQEAMSVYRRYLGYES